MFLANSKWIEDFVALPCHKPQSKDSIPTIPHWFDEFRAYCVPNHRQYNRSYVVSKGTPQNSISC